MPTLDIGRGELHYEEQGSGEPVLLVSGLNGLAAPWHAVAKILAPHFRVLTHDHLGMGGSGPRNGPCSVDEIAADVLAFMDRLGIARARLVGHSLGGAVVQAIAADYPERVSRLVVYASWPGHDSYFDRVMSARREVLVAMGAEHFLRTGPIGIYPPRWIRDNDETLRAALPGLLATFVGTDTMLQRIEACLRHERRASLQRIRAPTLVLGLEDDISTPPHCSEELADRINGATLQLLPYGGHNAHLVTPDLIGAAIRDFLIGKSASGPDRAPAPSSPLQ